MQPLSILNGINPIFKQFSTQLQKICHDSLLLWRLLLNIQNWNKTYITGIKPMKCFGIWNCFSCWTTFKPKRQHFYKNV